MFKLGEYYEDVARDVAKYLRDAGMKVDIRTFTVTTHPPTTKFIIFEDILFHYSGYR